MVWMHHVPSLIPRIFTQFVWNKNRDEKKVYLTFDDGPVPGVTDFVLDELEKRNMKATFFMVGDNIEKHLDLAKKVFSRGHEIGNHTYHHVSGYKTSLKEYMQEVDKCQSIIQTHFPERRKIFRPPYGKITKKQMKSLLPDFEVIMWDVLTGDYDAEQGSEKCLSKSIQHTRNGSIILFHDQKKTEQILKKVLPEYLDFVRSEGFETGLL